jgi:3-phosphoshikimate 1-carboxyvinyltransferase
VNQQMPADHPTLTIRRSGPLRGTCRVPGDKSISHRALLFGALADGAVEARGLGRGGDNLSTAAALRALGVDIEIAGDEARVRGVGFAGLTAAAGPLDCGNSGTTIRLMMGLLAGRPFQTELFGDASLTRRPMRRVAEPLRRKGATVEGRSDPARAGDVFPPVRVQGGALAGIAYDLPVASAQLKSALVLAGLQAKGVTTLREPGRSRDHTERMLRAMGAPISVDPATGAVVVDPSGWNGKLRAIPIVIPGDLSSATFLFVAAATVAGSDVVVENVGLNPTRAGALDALAAMGADISVEPQSDALGEPVGRVRVRASRLRGTAIAGELALRSIDEIPALAVAAATVAGSAVVVENVGLNPTRAGALDSLAAMGADISFEPQSDALGEPVGRVRVRASRLRGTTIGGELALRSIDEIPALAVAAALADGETVFADLAELRVKESDRIVAVARELRRAGVAVDERPDGFVVTGLGGRPAAGGTVRPEHDHRIAMAGAVLGLSAGDETIVPAADIATSFPTFAETLAALGAAI